MIKTDRTLLLRLILLIALALMSCSKDSEDPSPIQNDTITDIEMNVYKTIKIGTQVWMAENLKTTKYKDGTSIPLITENTVWANLLTPGYCWYGNSESFHKNTYGALYNWHTVNTGKLCPKGWHVPSDAEWTILITYLGGESVAGAALKEAGASHWSEAYTGSGTNTSGFTALPGGFRNFYRGEFEFLHYYGFWWSSTEDNASNAWYLGTIGAYKYVGKINNSKNNGLSVRCLCD